MYPAWCGGFGSITLSFVPLPAEALAFLRGELLETLPPPLSLAPQALTFLRGYLLVTPPPLTFLRRELVETPPPFLSLLSEALTFLGGHLLVPSPPLVPLPAEALTFLGRELLEPVPLSPHSFLFLGGKLSELLESLAEGLTPLRRQLLPATELVPKPLSFLWGKLAPAPVVFPDLLLLPPWKLSESFQPFLQGLLLFWGEGLPFTMAPLQLLPLLGRETVPPPSELVLARPRLGRGLRLGEGLPMRSRRRGLLTPGRGGGHQEEHTTHERSHNASHRALSSVWDSRG